MLKHKRFRVGPTPAKQALEGCICAPTQDDMSNCADFSTLGSPVSGPAGALAAPRAPPLPPMLWLDLETGGLDESHHEILEIGAILVDAITQVPSRTHHVHVRPTKPVPAEAARMNGFTPARWEAAGACTLDVALATLAPLLEGAMLAGSNPGFDLRFLRAGYAQVSRDMPKLGTHRLIDVAAIAWPLVAAGVVASAGLDSLATYFGVPGTPHRAFDDAKRAMGVYAQLLALYAPVIEPLRPRPT